MLIYFAVLIYLLSLNAFRYRKGLNYLAFLPIFVMLAFKGAVGCDYYGYYNHYLTYQEGQSIIDLRGEVGWYYVESLVDEFGLDYQWYYYISGIIATACLFRANHRARSLGLIALIFPIIFVQLGLSGIRQFLAVCIVLAMLAEYVFKPPKTVWPFVVLTLVATTFHVSALFMLIVLPFIFRLKPIVVALLVSVSLVAILSSFAEEVYSTYEYRYVNDRTRVSNGAWIRFALTAIVLFIGTIYQNKKYYKLGLTLLVLGLVIGVFNSIALHRMNYFIYPIAAMLLVDQSRRKGSKLLLWTGLGLSLGYMSFWFLFSTHSDCLIPFTWMWETGVDNFRTN